MVFEDSNCDNECYDFIFTTRNFLKAKLYCLSWFEMKKKKLLTEIKKTKIEGRYGSYCNSLFKNYMQGKQYIDGDIVDNYTGLYRIWAWGIDWDNIYIREYNI